MKVYKDFETTVSRGHLEQNLERFDYLENIRRLSDFIAANPENTHAFHNRAIAFYNVGQIGEALADFDRAIICDAKNIKAHYLKAEIYENLKDFDKSLESYTAAIASAALKGESYYIWESLLRRADFLAENNQLPQALEDLTAAIEKSPSLRRGFLERGKVFYRLGLREEALADFENAAIFGENLDWFPILDILLKETALQKSGFIRIFLLFRELVEKLGIPADGADLDEAARVRAIAENRLFVIETVRSMGDAQIYLTPATERNTRYPPFDALVFAKPIPTELLETHWTNYETPAELFALFAEFERKGFPKTGVDRI